MGRIKRWFENPLNVYWFVGFSVLLAMAFSIIMLRVFADSREQSYNSFDCVQQNVWAEAMVIARPTIIGDTAIAPFVWREVHLCDKRVLVERDTAWVSVPATHRNLDRLMPGMTMWVSAPADGFISSSSLAGVLGQSMKYMGVFRRFYGFELFCDISIGCGYISNGF